MKTIAPTPPVRSFSRGFRAFSAAAGLAALLTSSTAVADVPPRSVEGFAGIYKVASSTDPMFPATEAREYFLDFGKGIQAGKLGGTVAISMRQNPNVKVRIMAWQYFPKQGALVIGNPYSESSRNAVARGVWKMTGAESGVIFKRGSYRMVLHRAESGDY